MINTKYKLTYPSSKHILALICIAFFTLPLLTSCDTNAKLTFTTTTATKLNSLGMVLPAGSCDSSAESLVHRFVVMNHVNKSVRKGDEISGQNFSISKDDFSYRNPVIAKVKTMCGPTPTECGNGLICDRFVDKGVDKEVCGTDSQSVRITNDPNFVVTYDKNQTLIILTDLSARTFGVLATGQNAEFDYFIDSQNTQKIKPPIRAKTSQSQDMQQVVKNFQNAFNQVSSYLKSNEEAPPQIGIFSFDSDVTYHGDGAFNNDFAAQATKLQVFARNRTGNNYFGANVKNALDTVYESGQNSGMPSISTNASNQDVTVILLVSGEDNARNIDLTETINNYKAKGIRVIVIHSDPPFDRPDFKDDETAWKMATFFPDYKEYISDQPPGGCSDDTECLAHETCRQFYGKLSDEQKTKKYCLPNRNPDTGRIGPIDNYAKLACETGGAYIYLETRFRQGTAVTKYNWIPWILNGYWEAKPYLNGFNFGEGHYNMAVQTSLKTPSQPITNVYSVNNTQDSRLNFYSAQ